MTDQEAGAYPPSTAFHYEIRVDGTDDVMGVVIPVVDEIMRTCAIEDVRAQTDALLPSAVEATLKRDRPEMIERPWEVLCCEVIDFAIFREAGPR